MFHIAKRFWSGHTPVPPRVAKPAIMRRLTCISALACCLLASCDPPPVAQEVIETGPKKAVAKNTEPQPDETPLPPNGRKSVMTMDPRILNTMPERREMQATAPPVTAASGPNLMVPAPKPAPAPSE